jgi:Fe2+ or Zn2+ uptake regulation protein
LASFRTRPGTWTPPSLLAIAKKQDPDIDRATVYRTIALLKDRGLIDELDLMHLEGEKHYYEVKTSRDHCHMACFECGAIMEYASSSFEKLKREIAKQSRFQIRVVRLEVGGLCKDAGRPMPSQKRIFYFSSCDIVARGNQNRIREARVNL